MLLSANTTKYTMDELDEMFTTFHSFDSIMRVFQKPEYQNLIEIKELMQVYWRKKDEILQTITTNATHLYPFISIDGFQKSGKTTIARRLCESTGSIYVVTPAHYLLQLRIAFDSLNCELRSAFYGLVNYLTSYHIMVLRRKDPVIVDRYWHALISYTLAENFYFHGVFPDVDSIIYTWPSDLPKPDAAFLLDRSTAYNYISTFMSRKMLDVYENIKDPKVEIITENNFEYAYLKLLRDITLRFNLTCMTMH